MDQVCCCERTKAAWQFILNLRRQDIYAAAEVPYERPVLYFGFSEADDQAIIEFLRRGRNKGGWAAFADEHPEHTLSVWRGHVTRNASRLYQAAGVPYVRRTPPPVTAAQRARLVTFVAARHFGNRKVSWREFVKANPERSLQSWQGVLHRYAADIFAAAGITYNRRPVFSKFGDEDDNKLIAFLRNGDSMRQGWSQFCAENPERSQQGWESRLLSQAERLYAVAGVPLVRKGTEGAKGSDDATVAAGEPPLIFRALSPTGGTEHHTQSVASVSGHRAERGLDDVGEIYRRRVHQPFTPSDDAKIVNFLSESGLDVHEAILWFALKNTERTMSKWRAYFLKNYDRFMKEISRYTAQLVPKIPLDEPSVSEGIRAAFENLRLPLASSRHPGLRMTHPQCNDWNIETSLPRMQPRSRPIKHSLDSSSFARQRHYLRYSTIPTTRRLSLPRPSVWRTIKSSTTFANAIAMKISLKRLIWSLLMSMKIRKASWRT
ncbi:hypothetical protein DL93DRAFT_776753 [Clavulina sp. PMI_390]|nr:hypothetical protein DL93DRAFT_776753 [Clavulina sp. PMI_390]